ncbi:unnamed protein product [[Candida] boidinii]|uniref:Unnamed protein product n=1 Tax=Candida boidinii TaxID=5477 RepID=A0ACB5TKN7_CANBO|nr:unnamed protein product [[Candida] boidinii]
MEHKRSLSEEFKQPQRRSSGGNGGGVDGSASQTTTTTNTTPSTNSNSNRKSFYFSSENIINSNNNIYQNELKELTKIEQEITLNLQEIDKNLSITNKLINEKILKNLIKINKNSNNLFKNLNFWKLFFENSANVEIVTNDINEEENAEELENGEINKNVEIEKNSNFNDTTSQSDFESLQRNYQLNLSNLPNMDSEITGDDNNNDNNNNNNNDTSSMMNLGDSFWKDPTKTRKNLTSSTPNRELVGIRTEGEGKEGEAMIPPPPVPNFGRSNSDAGNLDEANDSESLVIPAGLQYALSDINNDNKNVTNNNNGNISTSKWKLQQSPGKSISQGILLDNDSTRNKKKRRRSSIVGSLTPKRRGGAGSGDTMTMAARYNSSPEEEPPVLESDIYFSPLRKKNNNNDENDETPLSKAARLNIEKSDIQRFPKSPKYGAGGVLLRSNIGHQVALNFAKSQLVKSNSSLGPSSSNSRSDGGGSGNTNEGKHISNELQELENDGGTLTSIFLNQQNDSTTFDETPDLQVDYMDYEKEDDHHDEGIVQEKAKNDEENNTGTGILPDFTETATATTKAVDANKKSVEGSETVAVEKNVDSESDKVKEIPVSKSDDSNVNEDREPNPFLE